MSRVRSLAALCLLSVACTRSGSDRGLVVIAIDGMDPQLLERYMAEGRTPNLKKLSEDGTFVPLGTSNPPQSPVAWSNFITGHESDHHGIYDFLHRDPKTLTPYLSTSKAEGPSFTMEIGDKVLPFGGAVKLLRAGEPFWSDLARAGIKTTVVKIPANYPPVEESDAEVLSGMGTPDLLGTPGLFQLFTTDPDLIGKDVSGGRIHALRFDTTHRGTAELDGPPDPFSPDGASLTLPLKVVVDDELGVALVEVGDARAMLRPGEWSEWLPIGFDAGMIVPAIPGMVRLHLVSLGETVTLYVSPVNMDPVAPAQPISSPEDFAAEIAAGAGRFYTQGMPEDTKGLLSGALSDDEFLEQSELVFEERKRMLERELARYDGGFLFVYFSEVDLVSHMFWRGIEPDASEEDAKYAHVLPDLYAKMDGVVGRTLEAVGDRATVLVMSDHGFAPYRYKVNLNTWLARRGYLVPAEKPTKKVLGHIDWAKTRAYALGLNQLYLNLAGREPDGIVREAEADWLLSRIQQELEEMRDPNTGRRVVTRTFRPAKTRHTDRVADLIVGFARGYRSADESALGEVGPEVIQRNTDKWSGDHCMDPAHVPGVLLSTAPIAEGDWALIDLAPSIMSYFGLPGEGAGRSFFAKER